MKKSRSKFLKIVDEKHDINFHWPNNKYMDKLVIYRFIYHLNIVLVFIASKVFHIDV
jgi:hypothetical protein